MSTEKRISRPIVDENECKGCGLCVASCRSGAINLRGFNDAQIFAMIDNI